MSSQGYCSVGTTNFHKTFRNLIICNPAVTTSWNWPSGSKDSEKKKNVQELMDIQEQDIKYSQINQGEIMMEIQASQ